jgi:hypothetical protein
MSADGHQDTEKEPVVMRLADRHTDKRGKHRPQANNPHDGANSDRTVRLARCLRRHGVNVADPQPGQPLKLDDQDQDRQELQQANQACQREVGSAGWAYAADRPGCWWWAGSWLRR